MSKSYILFMSLLMFTACSSSQRIAHYDLRGKTVDFRSSADTHSMSASVWVDNPIPEARSPWTALASLFLSIGGSAKAKAEVKNAVDPSGVAAVLSDALSYNMEQAFGIFSSTEEEEEAEYVMNTRLTRLSLISNADGVFLRLKVEQRFHDVASGRRLWKYTYDERIPLRFHSTGIADPTVMAIEGIISGVELLSMDEAEIQDAVLAATRIAGTRITDRFGRFARRASK